MNEKRLLNGLKEVRSECRWLTFTGFVVYCMYWYFFRKPDDIEGTWIGMVIFIPLLLGMFLSDFIRGYEKDSEK